jgi:hypothetical protein
MESRIQPRRNAMQRRNILIHIVVAFAALHAAVNAAPAAAARACEVCPEGEMSYPGPYVVYPEGYVVFPGGDAAVGQ